MRAILLSLLLAPALACAEPAPRLLSVSGEAQVAAAPDLARLSLGAVARARAAGDAMNEASGQMRAIMEAMRDLGVEPRDLMTTELSLSPVYDYNRDNRPPELTGYEARMGLQVRLREIGRVGAAVDAAARAGANQFQGVSFDIAERGALEDEALKLAAQEARRRAGLIAEASGVTLGAPVSISHGVRGVMPRPAAMMRADMGEAAPVATGELSVSATVSISYEFTP